MMGPIAALLMVPLQDVVDVEPGATCLQKDGVVEQLQTWLRRDQVDGGMRLSVRGDPQRSDSAVVVLQRGDDVPVERQIDDGPQACADFHTVVGLVGAIALDSTVAKSLGLEPSADATGDPVPTVSDRVSPARPSTPSRTGINLAAGGTVLANVLPNVAAGGFARLDIAPVQWLDLRVSVAPVYALPFALGDSSGTADVVLVAAGFGLCGGKVEASAALRGCVGVLAGPYVGRGRDIVAAEMSTVAWAAASAGVDLAVRITKRAHLGLGIDAVAPFVNPTLTARIDGDTVEERGPPLGLSVAIGPVISLR